MDKNTVLQSLNKRECNKFIESFGNVEPRSLPVAGLSVEIIKQFINIVTNVG